MRLGAVFPNNEIGGDPAQVKAWAQGVEALGYAHATVLDHVLGADPNRPDKLRGPYTLEHSFREPFVLLAYLAAVTARLELTTGILVLPQRQTALVAKQSAEVDVLSGGRLRIGVGIGWNHVEYEALGEDFHVRGRRFEEQIAVLRALWTQPRVVFRGRWHTIDAAGINPLPVQRPIPLWFGGTAKAALERAGRLADGWLPSRMATNLGGEPRPRVDDPDTIAGIETVRAAEARAGRPPGSTAIEGRVVITQGGPNDWAAAAAWWRGVGATHLSFRTMDAGLRDADAHLEALRRFKEAVAQAAG